MYLDEADHVGVDDQPFYFDGMLNVFKMRSMLARMDLTGTSLAAGKATFTKAYDALRARGGGTISVYYHPNEWVQTEFWDGVNFSGGANPPRSQWKPPGTRPVGGNRGRVPRLRAYLAFMKAQPGVRFVTASDLMRIYKDAALSRSFTREDLRRAGSRRCRRDHVSEARRLRRVARRHFRAAEHGSRIVRGSPGALPTATSLVVRCTDRRASSNPLTVAPSSQAFAWAAFADAVHDVGATSCRVAQTAARRDLDRIRKPVARRLSGHARWRLRGRRHLEYGARPGRAARGAVHGRPIRRRGLDRALELADLSRRVSRAGYHGARTASGVDAEARSVEQRMTSDERRA